MSSISRGKGSSHASGTLRVRALIACRTLPLELKSHICCCVLKDLGNVLLLKLNAEILYSCRYMILPPYLTGSPTKSLGLASLVLLFSSQICLPMMKLKL